MAKKNINNVQRKNRTTKTDIYRSYGIQYDRIQDKIFHPVFGWIKPLLINGNDKLGKGVYTFSTLPTNKEYSAVLDTVAGPVRYNVFGTCPCHCDKCYATRGRYVFDNVVAANMRKTIIARSDLDFMVNAILAQIKADRIRICRIHAAGDFCSMEYINAWRTIVKNTPDTIYWTYTKNPAAENAFDDLDNINIVHSCIPGIGFNFGHCDYIIRVYNILKSMGKKVYICRCGVDKQQHCTNCHGCFDNEIVLFIEHSTEYKAEKDPLFPVVKELIENQADPADRTVAA
jgi:hypothetical protein